MNLDLERYALDFLLYEKKCDIVSLERGVNDTWGRPDVLGVTRDRKFIEVEIKKSFSDFKINFDKLIIRRYQEFPKRAPHYFYFLVHPDILEKVLKYSNDKHLNYGVLSIDKAGYFLKLKSYRKASLNKEALKISVRQMIQMVKNQTRTLMEFYKNQDVIIESKVNQKLLELKTNENTGEELQWQI